MANKQIDMQEVKMIFRVYSQGIIKRGISEQLGISRNTVTKYIAFFQCYKLTSYEVDEMTWEELHMLFKFSEKPKSERLHTNACHIKKQGESMRKKTRNIH